MTITINDSSHEDCRIAAGVAGKTKVVSCPNPADAASPVHLYAGDHLTVLGQSADFRHHIMPLGDAHAAAVVQSWWDNDRQGWYTTIDGVDAAESEIKRIVRQREDQRAAKQAEEQRAKDDAASEKMAIETKATRDNMLSLAARAGEQWAPGRIAVKISNDRKIIVGRWAEPYIPGSGRPNEVRRAVANVDGDFVLANCDESYKFCWG